jgi:hypothetical protein
LDEIFLRWMIREVWTPHDLAGIGYRTVRLGSLPVTESVGS